MSNPKSPPDPWAGFPGGNPFGPNSPFGGSDPFSNMDAWLRSMGMDASEFRKLVDEMQRNMQEALKEFGKDPSKSFVSGFSVKVGPDGKPSFNTFGNKPSAKPPVPGGGMPAIISDEREPLTDVIEEGGKIAITMELPGVSREDIDLNMTELELEISVDNERRKYHKRVKLPAKVDPSTTKATYTNGILDVTVAKTGKGNTGVKIPVG
ncbi:MAG TPA: archaeal heat shock protein Hsp20 [Candidatus Thermoplasmatota archaeon]|nr:archaeal heat shock protein Hsp20 [Candidatus Thermoplasmatota archaeon]